VTVEIAYYHTMLCHFESRSGNQTKTNFTQFKKFVNDEAANNHPSMIRPRRQATNCRKSGWSSLPL
jgi:hypothetical protein